MSEAPAGPTDQVVAEHLVTLKNKLRELLQMDRGDLDFGLYRIMAFKRAEVDHFLEHQLLPQAVEALQTVAREDSQALEKNLAEVADAAVKAGIKPDESPRVRELKDQLAIARREQLDEAEVYNHLYTFFSRYYIDGDFMTLRRYRAAGKEAYVVPYDGEEVKLLWANFDQYYIKTTENYASYAFILDDDSQRYRVRFEIAAANGEQNDVVPVKGNNLRFVLAKDFLHAQGEEMTILFEHRPLTASEKKRFGSARQQQSILQHMEQQIHTETQRLKNGWSRRLFVPHPTEKDENRTLIGKHLAAYTAKNDFDYFIHKNLDHFLRRELDFYMKNEVLSVDNLTLASDPRILARSLSQMKAIKLVGDKIIDFLAQLENFQKRLWLKKKFVLETQYCVTLDRIPETFYKEIVGNKAQREEWVRLFAIDKLQADLVATAYSEPLKTDFLKANPHLVLDTRHFDRKFTDRLLQALAKAGPIEQQMDGLLVHGENFQALNLIQARYCNQIQAIYIDPPYNTDTSAILYKNGYKDSSWLSLMYDRFLLSEALLPDDGIVCVAIDDEEVSVLRQIMADRFAVELGTVAVRSNPAGRKTKARFAPAHEYALFFGKTATAVPGYLEKTEEQLRSWPHEDEEGRFSWTGLLRSGTNDRREDRPTMHYPIVVDNKSNKIRIPQMDWDADSQEYILQEEINSGKETAIYPKRTVGGVTFDGCWHRRWEKVADNLDEYRATRSADNGVSIQFKKRMDEASLPHTWWDKSKYASLNGTKRLNSLFARAQDFDFPKSPALVMDCIACATSNKSDAQVLDYFAGSGTTGEAVIRLNRKDGGSRKYMLVEVGHHFDSVLLPRIKKAVHSEAWKDGKPSDGRQGISQLFKYVRLESYEDSLDSLTLEPKDNLFAAAGETGLEDYQLRYMLNEETATNVSLLGEDFTDPFNYSLSVVRDGIRREQRVDLVETFNFLVGLKLVSHQWLQDVLVIAGTDSRNRRCVILWRRLGKDPSVANRKLEVWFRKHRDELGVADLDLIYVNGDHCLNALRRGEEHWEAQSMEPAFRQLMFATCPEDGS